jgi:S1-C subfamily serine protease
MITMTPDHETQEKEPRRGSGWVAVLMAVVLFAGGVGVGWLFTEPAPEPASDTAVEQPVASDISATTTTTVVRDTGLPPSTDPLVSTESDEPVADVAEMLLPAIVQIRLPGAGVGSGVIYASDGKIMTAAHVVEGFDTVEVVLSTGEREQGSVLGADSGNDIAVIEINRSGLPAAPLALDTKPRVGQMAVALGSPWGLDSTVTAGIVSAVDRALPDFASNRTRLMLQTDAPINPGNSGGALAGRDGRVIGINVSIFSVSGANDGVGFAVPIDRAFRVAEALVAGGEFAPGYLGVQITQSEDGSAGAVVTTIVPGTPAASSGLQIDDRVISMDGAPIADGDDLAAQVGGRQAGDVVELVIVRDGEELTIEVQLAERPADLTP